MNGPEEVNPPFLFDGRHCELARAMKEAGLPWAPHPGCYVFDPWDRIGDPSPFGNGIYFILDVKPFIRRMGSLERLTSDLVWLPTVDQTLWICRQFAVRPAPVEAFREWERGLNPGDYLLVLYEGLLGGLRGRKEAALGGKHDDARSALQMYGPLDRVKEAGDGGGELERLLRDLFASSRLAVLATRMGEQPYTNLVAFASSPDLHRLIFATTRSTRKLSNLGAHPLVSLLVDNRTNDVSDLREAVAVCATGTAREAEPSECTGARGLYLDKHPYLEEFVNSPSCVFVVVEVNVYYVVRRFQNVTELHLHP